MGNDGQSGVTPGEAASNGGVSGIPAPDAVVESVTPTPATTTSKPASAPNEATIDWSKVNPADIPQELVEKHAAYKAVLTESIERRNTIKELKQQSPAGVQANSADNTNPLAAEVKALQGSVNKLLELQERDALTNARNSLATQYNVPASRVKYIVGDTAEQMEQAAKELGEQRGGGVSGNSLAGNGAGDADALGALRNRIRAKAQDRGVETPSPFEPGIQRNRGGGPQQK